MGKTSKDKRDIYYRIAKQQGYRARSAYKLIQLDDTFQLLDGVTRVVDLCAAPGGWSQVIAERLRAKQAPDVTEDDFTIIAVDLMEMAPLDGVIQLKGDITHKQTVDEIITHFEGKKAQVVVSDGAPDVLGLHDLDEYLQAQLVLAGLNISLHVLEAGGAFVAKLFRGKEVSLLFAQLRRFFRKVTCAKPKASRNSSFEAFVVCEGFQLPQGYVPSMERNLLDLQYVGEDEAEDAYCSNVDVERGVCVDVVFLGSGDVFGFDADQSYPLDDAEYVHKEPLQKPINPPYKSALQKAKAADA
uniref:Putative tRNA (cytidine(32)/guanosine(34)-2'-O)-methyltransferase n=1 Tax=Globisporangium ultimum (strain ATCC 200006 / CBS 805.95 / DAOM BR144) TaxID=431595 RepID=K3X681_GLOUD